MSAVMRLKWAVLACAAAVYFLHGSAVAAQYPAKTVTIVVAAPPGGDTDVLARVLAEHLSARLKHAVVVENRSGASGIIGSTHVARATADGYTLLLAPSTLTIAQLVLKVDKESGYDVLHDFTPIMQVGWVSLLLATSDRSGFKSLADVLGASNSKTLAYATPGAGSPMHILGELFNRAAGQRMLHIPYRGVAPAVNDMLGGQVPLSYVTLGTVTPYLPDGKIRLLAVADAQRSAAVPQVPTLVELGYKGVEVRSWYGLFGPSGMKADVVNLLNAQLQEIIRLPDVIARMAALGIAPVGGPPEVLGETNAKDFERFGKLIQELGIRAE